MRLRKGLSLKCRVLEVPGTQSGDADDQSFHAITLVLLDKDPSCSDDGQNCAEAQGGVMSVDVIMRMMKLKKIQLCINSYLVATSKTVHGEKYPVTTSKRFSEPI